MKRSEAVNIILNTLLDNSNGYVKNDVIGFECSYKGRDRLREASEEVLKALLEEGMKPPVEKHCPVLLRTEHTWEDEENEL